MHSCWLREDDELKASKIDRGYRLGTGMNRPMWQADGMAGENDVGFI